MFYWRITAHEESYGSIGSQLQHGCTKSARGRIGLDRAIDSRSNIEG